jgi:hypothetical protein
MTRTRGEARVRIAGPAVENVIDVSAPPEVVFDNMTDVRNEPQWNPTDVAGRAAHPRAGR